MTTRQHQISLAGPDDELRVDGVALAEALLAVHQGMQRVVRLVVEGQSVRQGARPGWLDAMTRFDVRGLEQGSVALPIECPTFDSVVPGLAPEWAVLPPDRSAFDLFGRAVSDALHDRTDSELLDRGVLDACVRLARVGTAYGAGVMLEGIAELADGVVLTPQVAPALEEMRDVTPADQAVRVSGVLDTISSSRPEFTVAVDTGEHLRARFGRDEHDPDLLARNFGQRVTVSGIASFTVSGQMRALAVTALEPARPEDGMWSRAPRGRARSAPLFRAEAQDEHTGVAAFFGIWPGDESDEELLEALRAIR